MTQIATPKLETLAQCWPRYRQNFPRTLGALTVYIEQQAMQRLARRGHTRLIASFSTPMSMLALKPRRLTDLAEAMSVSKQLCLQSLKPLENLNYIERCSDPKDGRAKILQLSESGWQLVNDALHELRALEQEFAALIGARKLDRLAARMTSAYFASRGSGGSLAIDDIPLVPGITVALNRDIQAQLMQLTSRAGHHGLQMSFAQVLGGVDLSGSSISAIARQNGVSLSAISRCTKDLQQLGYVKRQTDSQDRRSRKILLTPLGLKLICDAIEATDAVEAELQQSLGDTGFMELDALLSELCESLELGESLLRPFDIDAASALMDNAPRPALEGGLSPRLEALLNAAEQLDLDGTLAGPSLVHIDCDGRRRLSAQALTELDQHGLLMWLANKPTTSTV